MKTENFVRKWVPEWMIDSYESGQEVVLVPNPNYYGEKPNIDKVVLKQVVDGDARVMALQSGEADLNLQDIPSESFSIIQQIKIYRQNSRFHTFLLSD